MRRQSIMGYKLVSPYIIIVGLLLIYFLSFNAAQSFLNTEGHISLDNYKDVFSNPLTVKIFFNTFVWVVGSVIGQFCLGLIVALLLNSVKFGQSFYRSVIFILPWVTLDIVAGVSWKWMYNDLYGVVNDILLKSHIIDAPISWLGNKNIAIYAVILANIWKGFSLAGLFILARLQTISISLYEAAEIDGANIFQKFIRITLPQIKTVSLSTLMLMVIWTINYFPLIFIMTAGGPSFSTETIVLYIYRLRFRFFALGESSALSNILFLVIFVISIFFLHGLSKGGEE